ncbi:PREDICTED: coiled-coil domain-containing protein 121 isoform X1 [Galeopterus variegatus]|uniref:Coiled-coil domain-containing protein 121 isoform X1 n=1 Tax=Galeopterus variegatus TaxID=482537 RepID=A0ABM0RG16_GALVR|nr:PREDICTED: coiled-coil domain-containing protein 121 isoform X1 [Galeopterus variegatus]
MGSQGRDSHGAKARSARLTLGPRRAGSGAAGGPAAGAQSAAEEVKQPRTGTGGAPRGCQAAPRPVEHRTEKLRGLSTVRHCSRDSQAPDASPLTVTPRELHSLHDLGDELLDSSCKLDKGPSRSSSPYSRLINNFLKPQKLTNVERRFKEKTLVEMMMLNKQIKQTQIQQELLLEENRQLYKEKLLVQAENKLFLEYLTKKTEEYRRQPEKLWNNYLQKSGEIEQRRQESASRYAKLTSVLKTELLQKEKTQSILKQQLQAMRGISILKEKQEIEIQTLQEEKKTVQAEGAARKQEVQVQLLQEKALLEKQLSEPDMRQLGKRKRRELKRKAQALELAVRQRVFEFSLGINRENQQLGKALLQLTQQSQKLEATQSLLKNQKQQLQQEQWYLDCVIRGRKRLQRRHSGCLKGQSAPNTTPSPPLGTKSRLIQSNS